MCLSTGVCAGCEDGESALRRNDDDDDDTNAKGRKGGGRLKAGERGLCVATGAVAQMVDDARAADTWVGRWTYASAQTALCIRTNGSQIGLRIAQQLKRSAVSYRAADAPKDAIRN